MRCLCCAFGGVRKSVVSDGDKTCITRVLSASAGKLPIAYLKSGNMSSEMAVISEQVAREWLMCAVATALSPAKFYGEGPAPCRPSEQD